MEFLLSLGLQVLGRLGAVGYVPVEGEQATVAAAALERGADEGSLDPVEELNVLLVCPRAGRHVDLQTLVHPPQDLPPSH